MVLLLPSVLAAALLRTLDSHGHSAKKKSYASASVCVRSPFNGMDVFNFAWVFTFTFPYCSATQQPPMA